MSLKSIWTANAKYSWFRSLHHRNFQKYCNRIDWLHECLSDFFHNKLFDKLSSFDKSWPSWNTEKKNLFSAVLHCIKISLGSKLGKKVHKNDSPTDSWVYKKKKILNIPNNTYYQSLLNAVDLSTSNTQKNSEIIKIKF